MREPLFADHCQSWSHTELQANSGSFVLRQRQELRNAAKKAKPAFNPAKKALAQAQAQYDKAAKKKDAAAAALSALIEAQQAEAAENNGKYKESLAILKASKAIRPRDAAAVGVAQKEFDSVKKVCSCVSS